MNKENKKKIYDILNNNSITPTPQQKFENMKQKEDNNNNNNNNSNNNKKSTYEQQQEQRRRLLEEYKRKKEAEKQNKLNNKIKDKQTAIQKKINEEKKTKCITKIEPKNASAYSSPSSSLNNNKSKFDNYQTPVQDPIKRLSPKKSMSSTITVSSTSLSPMQQHQITSLTSLEPMPSFEEVMDDKDLLRSLSISQSPEKMKSKFDNNIKSPVSGRSQGLMMIDDNSDVTVNDDSPSRTRLEYQRVASPAKSDLYRNCISNDSPLNVLSPYRRFSHKRSPVQPNPAILSFGKAQRMKKDSIETIDDIESALSKPVIYSIKQVPRTPPSTITSMAHMQAKGESLGNNVRCSGYISEYDNSEDNSSFEFNSSPTVLLPKLKRLTPKRSPASNPAIASLGKAQRIIKVVGDEDSDDKDFPTPKASDYTNNTSVTGDSNDGSKIRNFFSILSSTPFNEMINKTGRLLDFSQAEESTTDNSFVEQKVEKCVDELMNTGRSSTITGSLEISGIQKTNYSFNEMSPFIKDISIQTSPCLLDRFPDQLKSQKVYKGAENSKFNYIKWSKHYVLCVYDPKTYDIKYTEVVPFPTISFFSIKDAVHVAETGSELLARAMFYILEADWPPHSKKIGILAENIPPREKARYWIERARFEERCMRYEEALQSYEMALELDAKPIELVKEEYEKFLVRICSFSQEHEEPIDYKVDNDVNDYSNENNNELVESDLSVLLEYESDIDYNNNNNNEFSEGKSPKSPNGSIIQGNVEPLDKLLTDKIDKEENKEIVNKNSARETPESIDSSLTLLALVKAKKKERKEIGVEKVVTPVRRSARIQKSSGDYHTPEDQKIATLLEENSLAYVPNPALYYNKNLTPLKKSSKKNDDIDETVLEKPKPISGKKTVTWKDLKKQ